MKELGGGGGQNDVVDVEEQVDGVGATAEYEQGCVRLGLHEAECHQE